MELNKDFITKHVGADENTISPLGYTDDDEMVSFGKCRPSGEFVLRHVIESLVSTCYSASTKLQVSSQPPPPPSSQSSPRSMILESATRVVTI